MDASSKPVLSNISILIELEQEVRKAESLGSLQFVIVNQTNRLVSYDQAVFLSLDKDFSSPRVKAISNVPAVDKTTPFVQWIERMAGRESKGDKKEILHEIAPGEIRDEDAKDWNELSPAKILWIPLIAPQQGLVGILWLGRHRGWTNNELTLLDHLSLCYAHGLQVFLAPWRFSSLLGRAFKKPFLLGMLFLGSLGMFLPVKLTALAPVEVVPQKPYVIAAPMNGVVKKICVSSNEHISPGQTVACMDDTEVRNNVEVAAKTLDVARVQLEKAERGAFVDNKNKEVLAELAAQVDLRRAELDYARERLDKSLLVSEKEGVAIVDRPETWAGRPVRVGEKILQVADPSQVEFRIMLPVKDAILLEPGNDIRIFLDSSPMAPRQATVERFQYEPELTELGNLAYSVSGVLSNPEKPPRIGLRGTAKIFGKTVTLFYYLFRKPLTFVRQWMGF